MSARRHLGGGSAALCGILALASHVAPETASATVTSTHRTGLPRSVTDQTRRSSDVIIALRVPGSFGRAAAALRTSLAAAPNDDQRAAFRRATDAEKAELVAGQLARRRAAL